MIQTLAANCLANYGTLSLLCLLAVCAYLVVRFLTSPWRKLPPGPAGLPILGNILQVGKKQWITFSQWRRRFGDIVYLNMAGQPVVVLNSSKVAADLLDRRAAIYSDRPRNIVASDILTGGLMLVFSDSNSTWRRMRKAAHEGLQKGVVHNYHPSQRTEALLLTSDLLSSPDQWDSHFRRLAASTILSLVYDLPPVVSEHDPSVRQINNFVARLVRAVLPGAYLVEVLPWMRHIPSRFMKWKRQAEEWYQKDSAMFEGLLRAVRDQLAQGDERPSLAATLIEDAGRNGLSERENAWLAGNMYAAGSDTTAGVLSWWLLAMTVYPEVQRRAHAELDAVVGRHRLPTFADFEQLPYIRAMVKEALRWRSTNPIGLPHRSCRDDWYEGYFIPSGTIVIPNIWELHQDVDSYGPDVMHFNPARHLDGKGALRDPLADTKDEGHFTFGFGRRLCVGRHVANNSLFIAIATIIWAVNIQRKKDGNGIPLPLDVGGCVADGLSVRPMPFECDITPRFPEASSILVQGLESLERPIFRSSKEQ